MSKEFKEAVVLIKVTKWNKQLALQVQEETKKILEELANIRKQCSKTY